MYGPYSKTGADRLGEGVRFHWSEAKWRKGVKEGPGVSCNNFLKGNRTGSSFSLVVLCEKDITKGKKNDGPL